MPGSNLVLKTVSGSTATRRAAWGVRLSWLGVNSTISEYVGTYARRRVDGWDSLLRDPAANGLMAGGNSLDRFGLGSELTFRNTILANQAARVRGLPPASTGNNIISDRSCGQTQRRRPPPRAYSVAF